MTWRKWLVRTLVFLILGGLGVGAMLYQRWTNPEAVRAAVLEKLSAEFPGATVSLDSAQLRLLGGISLNELHLARRDDPDKTDFLYVPSAIIFHDKEQLLDGKKLVLRKIELYRPRLHIIRGPDGKWNLADLVGPSNPDQPMPTLVVKQGTIVLETRTTGSASMAPPLELKDVNFTLINDPLPTVSFAGAGTCDVIGPVQFSGSWQRDSHDAVVSIEALHIPVGPALVQRLAAFAPEAVDHLRYLEGTGKLKAELTYHPASSQPWSDDIRFQLTNGKFRHAQLPVPLDHVELSLRCVNGQLTLEKGTAQAGSTQVSASFKDLVWGKGDQWEDLFAELDLNIDHLELTHDVCERLPPDLDELRREYAPAGTLSLSLALRRDDSGWHKRCLLRAEDASAEAVKFPYRLEHITGTLEQLTGSEQPPVLKLDLTGQSNGRPIFIKGTISGKKPDTQVAVDIWGDDIPLDAKLLHALPVQLQPLAESFHPTGKGNFRTTLHRDPHTHEFTNRHVVLVHDATVFYHDFPYPLENVVGVLDIQPDHWEFRDFHGTHNGGEFRANGHSAPAADGDHVLVHMSGQSILLDDTLAQALPPGLKKTWGLFAPDGRIDFAGTLAFTVGRARPGTSEHAPRPCTPPEIELTVCPRGCSIEPKFFPYTLEEIYGRLRYAHNWVVLEGMRARHGASVLTLGDSYVYVGPDGGYYAELNDLQGNPILPDAALVRALPGPVAAACRTLELKDPLTFRTRLIFSGAPDRRLPDIYWDGALALHDASLRTGIPLEHVTGVLASRGRHNGQQLEGVVGNLYLDEMTLYNQSFHGVQSPILVTRDEPTVLRLNDLWASYCGGEIYGPMRVEFGTPVRYELRLTASQIQLDEFGRHNVGPSTQLSGVAHAGFYLSGEGTDLNTLKGGGNVDVPNGAKLYDLPLLLDLLKVLGLRWPDRTLFEEAHANFEILGDRIQVNRMNLIGNAISLRGQGDVKLDGSDLNLDFHADWARLSEVLPPGIKSLPPLLSDQILKIKMRGRIGDVHCSTEVVPAVMGSLREIKDAWSEIRSLGDRPAPPVPPVPPP